ncbi:MinD/ParA family protein [Legionella israelensis]|uniref:Flagellar biosynthesis MinD n=1 Tax=Legionella israelensis TaxID=454 RepID=A0A0W0VUA8_9GAMM|nr:flagellar biosynthesis MinD [Legionella israelensis]QBR84040.1 MinD/ParA family protein [Legionella israelensis]QBS10926.1 MinD/ParA family protein [Legionella israelensis]SCX79803.1 flagellar biosynthesis protein FlhG [Legionella israelensis DSM 19235]STX57916.1 flagellar biosynthesis MinD [Legionella israelensis]
MPKDQKINTQDNEYSRFVQTKPVMVIAVTAGKGGVGKTNVSVNLAIALAQKKKAVLLLDADLGLANVDIMLGLHSKYNLSHVIEGKCHLSEIILPGPANISVIPAASGTAAMTRLSPSEHAGIIDAFNELMDDLDYMIIDTAAGISDTVLSFTRSSQEVIIVLCDEPTSLTDAYALMKVLSKYYGVTHFHILANMVRQERDAYHLYNRLYDVCEQFLEVKLNYLGSIPFDERVHEAIKKQEPILLAYPDSAASSALRDLADAVEAWPLQVTLGGNTRFFLDRLVASK